MCGIVGAIAKRQKSLDLERVRDMLGCLQHRGPDGEGFFASDTAALGQTRLAIIDHTGGKQPFFLDHLTLVANAEIYNYQELKQLLSEASFKTESDIEPLLFLYRRYGLDFVKLLRGMFALAIYDRTKGELILARDPFGIKPLYYAETPAGFFFASELQALLKAGVASRELDPEMQEELLQLRFTVGRDTPFKEIKRVLPGEVLRVYEGVIVASHIRTIPLFTPAAPLEDAEAFSLLDKHLDESVRLHLRSDVPYGLFLSGGVDSSTLLALMHRITPQPVQTFTTVFPESPKHDESAYARATAQVCGANHHEVPFTEADFWEFLPRVVDVVDDPFLDYSALPTYKMASVAKAHGIKVILCGEGADELLAGYRRYRKASWPWWLGGRIMRQRGNFSKTALLRHQTEGWKASLQSALQTGEGLSNLQRSQGIDCKTWLPSNLLNRLDRCLMAHGLEGRTPFLEPKLSAFLFGLPDSLKLRKGHHKWLLRTWLEANLPEARPFAKKQGFTFPAEAWVLKQGKVLGELLAKQPGIQELCVPEEVCTLFGSSSKKQGFLAWSLLFYALWHRKHVLGLSLEGGSVRELLDQA
ncbi:MAG: asparagine synthase (glutamine-hydrolyzing) [Alphaproteobacteria bacterium]